MAQNPKRNIFSHSSICTHTQNKKKFLVSVTVFVTFATNNCCCRKIDGKNTQEHPGKSDRTKRQSKKKKKGVMGLGGGGRTLGNLYIQCRPDQSHEGGVKMHRVVVGNRQIHA